MNEMYMPNEPKNETPAQRIENMQTKFESLSGRKIKVNTYRIDENGEEIFVKNIWGILLSFGTFDHNGECVFSLYFADEEYPHVITAATRESSQYFSYFYEIVALR